MSMSVPTIPAPAAPADNAPATPGEPTPNAGNSQPTAPPQLAGFNSPEELASAYQNLHSKMGAMGEEVGYLRAIVQNSLAKPEAAPQEDGDPLGDDAEFYAQLDQMAEDGEITPDEKYLKVAERIRDRADADKKSLLKSMPTLINEQVATLRHRERLQDWAKETPHFIELAQSGKLDEFVKSNAHPAVDNPFSAFFVLENQLLSQEMRTMQERHAAEMEALKKIAGAEAVMEHERLRAGTMPASTVVGQDGSKLALGRPPKMSPAEQKAYFIAKQRERAAAGG